MERRAFAPRSTTAFYDRGGSYFATTTLFWDELAPCTTFTK